MSKPRIGVVIHTELRDQLFLLEDQARLDALGEVRWTESPKPISVEAAIEILHDCEIGIGSWSTPYPSETLLAACPNLRLWEHAAGTVKQMFGSHLEGRDLKIASCKTALGDLVAEIVLGEIVLGLRRVFENATANRTSIAPKPAKIKTLWGATIGIVGASEIGKRMMQLLAPFSCHILLYDPYCTQAVATSFGATLVTDLRELCARADVVSLHTPDLPTTRHIMDTTMFSAMQDDAIFINSARGNCVDEAALIAELAKGRLFAFLDVSAPEPTPLESPFRSLPNVVYTSHIAGPPAPNIGRQAVEDVAAYLRGESPRCVVTADSLNRVA